MKKIIVILLLFSYLPTRAQEVFKNQYYFGINSGLNITGLNTSSSFDGMFDSSSDINFKFGYSGGIVFIYYSEPRKGIQMELNYSQRGWKEDLDSTNYSRKLEYFEFPFLSHFDFGLKNLNLSITAGPIVSYLISSHEQTNLMDENQIKSYYNKEIDNKLEAGLCIGLGVNIFTRNGIIQAEFRLNQGLSNIFSEESNIGFSASQNQAIGIKISYLFGW
jgi:hypothetical protein